MLAPDVPVLSCNALRFWSLRIIKEFSCPEYYIGQMVFHKMKVSGGEILHPVTVIGLWWTGSEWIYCILFPKNHPRFVKEDSEFDEVESWYLEPM